MGNGPVEAWVLKQGRLVTCAWRLIWGSSTVWTTGGLVIDLPYEALNWGAGGTGYCYDVSVPKSVPAVTVLNYKYNMMLSVLGYGTLESSYSNIQTGIPWTWAVGDEMAFEMTYMSVA